MFWVNNKYLEPAPLVTINKSLNFAGDGRPLSPTYTITLEGTILPDRGNPRVSEWYVSGPEVPDPTLNNTHDYFNAINVKQERIRKEFSATGLMIRYEPTGYTGITFYPRLTSINFAPDTWTSKSTYSIELLAHQLIRSSQVEDSFGLDATGYFLTNISDSFSIAERDDGTQIRDTSRQVSATANVAYGSGFIKPFDEPWKAAKAWVLNRIAQYPFATGDFYLGATGAVYNLVTEENVNKFEGTYSLSQRYIYHNANYSEQRTISRTYDYNLTGDGGPDFLRITLNGTIQGLDTTNNPSGKLTNARAYYNLISTGFAAYVGAYGNSVNVQYNENINNGSIDYTINYVNRLGNTYKHNYDVSYQINNGATPTVTIAGQIEGFTPSTYFNDVSGTNKFNLAVSGWNVVEPNLKALAFAYGNVFAGTGIDNYYFDNPFNKSIAFNKPAGTINYSYGYQFAGTGNKANKYTDEYTVEYNSPNSPADTTKAGLLVTATINGTIAGINTTLPENPVEKYNNAKTAWATIAPLLHTRVLSEANSIIGGTTPTLSSGAVNRVVGINRINGTINYSFTYNNFKPTGVAQLAAQDISVEDVAANDIFAVQIIPGRAIGPIIQNIGTTSERRRNINIALTLYPNAGNAWEYSDVSVPYGIASGLLASVLPTGVRTVSWWVAGDTANWNYKNGFYTRNVSIVY